MNINIAWASTLHEHQHCMSINIAWTSTLHEHQPCLNINIAWASTLHEHKHCMNINIAWASTLHEHQPCMNINIAWASTLHEHQHCMSINRVLFYWPSYWSITHVLLKYQELTNCKKHARKYLSTFIKTQHILYILKTKKNYKFS